MSSEASAGPSPRRPQWLPGSWVGLPALVVLVASLLTSSSPVLAASPGVQLSEAVPRTDAER
jgi:hypothetical protein